MTYKDRHRQQEPAPCRICGMDAGAWYHGVKDNEDVWCIQCRCCGFKTPWRTTLGRVTKDWKNAIIGK